jgi:hypothetical protein
MSEIDPKGPLGIYAIYSASLPDLDVNKSILLVYKYVCCDKYKKAIVNYTKCGATFLIFLILYNFLACNHDSQWKGQAPIKRVSTETVPVQLQYKGTFDLGNGIFMSNNYDGARLNGAARTNDTLISVLITPENSPINPSSWYGFKIWSETEMEIYIKLTYPENTFHRYYPKISKDGLSWNALDSMKYQVAMKTLGEREVKASLTRNISVSTDTLWVSAQELITSSLVDRWIDSLLSEPFVAVSEI